MPKCPTGNIVLQSIFLHDDLSDDPYGAPHLRNSISEVIGIKEIMSYGIKRVICECLHVQVFYLYRRSVGEVS